MQLRVVKVAPQLLHSGRGRGGVAPAAAEGSSPQQRQQEGQQEGGEQHQRQQNPPAEAAPEAAGGVEGRMGVGEELVGWGRMQQLWGNYNAIQSLLTRHF